MQGVCIYIYILQNIYTINRINISIRKHFYFDYNLFYLYLFSYTILSVLTLGMPCIKAIFPQIWKTFLPQ